MQAISEHFIRSDYWHILLVFIFYFSSVIQTNSYLSYFFFFSHSYRKPTILKGCAFLNYYLNHLKRILKYKLYTFSLFLISSILFIFLIDSCYINTCAFSKASVPDELSSLHAKAAVLMDGNNQRILFGKNEEKLLPMASTTKIMTCLYAIEHGNLSDKVTFSQRAASSPKVRLGAKSGSQFLLSDLLYALMLESYNDVAVAIAEHIDGSVEQFCANMTQEARDYGCYHTSFETPNGLDSAKHYTTCHDLALLTCLALKNDNFCKIIKEQSFSIKELKNGQSYSLNNKNLFLTSYDGAIGVKTGYTNNAGYCFVGAVKKDGYYLISVVLGSGWYPNRRYKWEDTKKLMDYGMNNYNKKEISLNQGIPSKLPVKNGIHSFCNLSIPKPVSLYISSSEKTKCIIQLPATLTAPIQKGTAVGSVVLYIDSKPYRSYPIYAKQNIKKQTFSWYYKKLFYYLVH